MEISMSHALSMLRSHMLKFFCYVEKYLCKSWLRFVNREQHGSKSQCLIHGPGPGLLFK